MLFNSLAFLLFLPCVFLLYWASERHWFRLLVVVVASYVFYAWADVRFLPLIMGMTLLGYACGLWADASAQHPKRGRAAVSVAAVVSLGILCVFKYYDFFLTGIAALLNRAGFNFTPVLWRIVLPVGISFYTFQTLAYVIDVYRGRVEAERNLLRYAAFIAFFPQLVAGPIERARSLLPQFRVVQRFDYALAVDGLRQMLWGFAKKVLVADRCAVAVNAVYSSPTASGLDFWLATILFAFQIYGDFSGYCDIAVGCGKLFGIRLSRNFNVPYFSRDVVEFWRRWHITLMTWFRDYLYIPLGGSHCGRWRHAFNVFVVFAASGLWHGAGLTFIAWGIYHALLFVPLIVLGASSCHTRGIVAAGRVLPSAVEAFQMLLTFMLVVVGWVLFRSESMSQAIGAYGKMFAFAGSLAPMFNLDVFIAPLAMIAWEWVTRRRPHAFSFVEHGLLRVRAVRWLVYYVMLFALFSQGGRPHSFIYFQF